MERPCISCLGFLKQSRVELYNMNESKIYVGNLSYNTTEDELRDYFAQFGTIADMKLIIDFNTGRSKGFGFITFAAPQDSEAAVAAANGVEIGGRKIKVNIARDDNRRSSNGGGGGFRHSSGGRPSFRDRENRADRDRG